MPEEMMQAIRLHEFGGPDVLRYDEVPVPEPGPGEVLVRVHAVGVNPPDWYVREGMPTVPPELRPPLHLPLIPGTDVSGVVAAMGAGGPGMGAGDLQVGDEVFGMLRFPGLGGSAYAEYVAAPVSDLARKPAGVDHVHAAGAPMAGLTAWQFLIELGHDHPSPFQQAQHQPVPLGAGTTLLVNGAAGGVGHLAVQLAKWRGARVVAVASGAHESFLRELGVDAFIDNTPTRPEDGARDVDLVLDAVGGPDSHRLLRTLRRGGALFPVFVAEFDPEEPAESAARGARRPARRRRTPGRRRQHLPAGRRAASPRASRPRAHPRQDRAHGRAGHASMTTGPDAFDDLFDEPRPAPGDDGDLRGHVRLASVQPGVITPADRSRRHPDLLEHVLVVLRCLRRSTGGHESLVGADRGVPLRRRRSGPPRVDYISLSRVIGSSRTRRPVAL